MDKKTLLQDLHFQLSNAGSGHISGSRERINVENRLLFEVEDRQSLTEKWVTHAYLRNRQRTLSSDSYFGGFSVCDTLKKSFLKPYKVTEDDLEDLRIRLGRVKLFEDSDVNDFRNGQRSDSGESDVKQGENDFVCNQRGRPVLQRFRSSTVPLCHSTIFNSRNRINSPVFLHEESKSKFTCNMASIQSVDLIKDILLDDNCNVIPQSVFLNDSKSQVKSLTAVEADENKLHSFRDESLIPSPAELNEVKHFWISPNKIIGSYKDAEDYLKTHFYLLKEDFIRPLKEGIADYRKQIRAGTIPDEVKNLKLHHNVHVTEPCIKKDRLGIAVEMGFPLSAKIGEKDFMEGSLILLTPNHFEEIFVGTVISRTFYPRISQGVASSRRTKGRKSNILMVQLHGASHFHSSLMHGKILLAESQAFFQPYYYVMRIFQSMTAADLPLKECILGSRKFEAALSPSYLRWNTEYILEDNFKVNVKNDCCWPSAEDLEVNNSQLIALKKALSQKLVLIQGPPGTGKTYLGCKVAKALLQNRQVWNKEGNRPMLLMCQTNHALDQFMELLLPVSKNVIRIGNQSKSDVLAPFNIREWQRKIRTRSSTHSDLIKQKSELKKLALNIQICSLELLRVSSHGVVDMQTFLSSGAVEPHYSLCFRSTENYLIWLEEARNCLGEKFMTSQPACCHQHDHTDSPPLQPKEPHAQFRELDENGLSSRASQTIDIKYVISFPDMQLALKKEENDLQEEHCVVNQASSVESEMEERLKFFQKCVLENTEDEFLPSIDPCLWTVPPNKRWIIYRSWIRRLKIIMQSHLGILEAQYVETSSIVAELQQNEKLQAMRKAELVGMTTSAAARLYPVLRKLRCPIVLVEEAAEVHESHIVATVTKHCQHLILLGDHKQLRPRPASYSLSRTHYTDVSLFERLLLNNSATVNTLLIQHRMQPEISALIRPSIYAELHDHECTNNRENILGMKKNVFFFSHRWPESKNHLTGSFSNLQEAKMAVQILRYLLKQNYNANEICILTAYREQVVVIEEDCKQYSELDGVRVLTVDNFQGEESRIIVLSLVRNNSVNQIGFLKIENRVCVALSRARDGLFILGNIELLAQNSELWFSVQRTLQSNASVGWSLPLACQRHPRKGKSVSAPSDLESYLQSGGCRRLCSHKLTCGHSCKRICHADDTLHFKYRCEEPCRKTCAYGHKCERKCFEECKSCAMLVWKHLDCGHTALTKCCVDLSNYLCGVTVQKCMIPCSHRVNLQCWMPSVSHKYCTHQCPAKLKCGHPCPLRCNAVKHPSHNKMKCSSCEYPPQQHGSQHIF